MSAIMALGAADPTPFASRILGLSGLRSTARPTLGGGSGFGPAALISRAAPPSVFVIYNADGTLNRAVANPTLTPTVAQTANIPYSVLYSRLGNTIRQVQLNQRSGGLPNLYTIGYRILV